MCNSLPVTRMLDSIYILQAGVCHNNVCMKSIYVCNDGSWRMGGLEHACKFNEVTPGFLQSCGALRCQEALAPEEKVHIGSLSKLH